MNFKSLALGCGLLCGLGTLAAPSAAQDAVAARGHSFTTQGTQFILDGKPFQIIAGDMEYARVPRAYWHDRLHKARMMGLNTITVYGFWNLHEPRPGVYDFHDQNDLAAYIRAAQQEGLYVIFRPGPYVCAEWELGGYPSWLLKTPAVTLRSQDPHYMMAVSRWFNRLGKEIAPLLLKNGGPILAVQVENEYGAFGEDTAYLEAVKRQVLAAGMGDALLFTSNQASDLRKGSLPEVLSVVNFGTGDARHSFAQLEAYRPNAPEMSGEYWAGWFDKWGEKHHETDGHKEADELRWMLSQGHSVSLYMFHGGTTFGWMNGADSHTGKDYHPDTTSYDYDAPLDETGSPRDKYQLFQQAIAEATHQVQEPVPPRTQLSQFSIDPVRRSASLWDNLPSPVRSERPLSFEDLDQNYGYVLYRTTLHRGDAGKLSLPEMHDYAQVYLDRRLIGTLDRRLGQSEVTLAEVDRTSTLDILVENTGRVNYSIAIRQERAGLTGGAFLNRQPLRGWAMYPLPMNHPEALHFRNATCDGPCFFQTVMHVPKATDTYLNTRELHKGQMWVGGHNLGRFWSIGPQFTLYTPAPWETQGATTLTFFDLLGGPGERISSVTEPVYGEVTGTREAQ